MTIVKLAPHIASRIAAGEVIERPVSVVKELLENSVDSGATRVNISISNGGVRSIVVDDDGSGIAFEELPLAIDRHATSKIRSLEDLEAINTLGYRGEALSSIATVSRMDIRSRREEDGGGCLVVEGGQIKTHISQNCQKGTRIQVNDLFFNLPARRKFLKSASGEFRRISRIVQDYGIAYPEIAFTLTHDGKKSYTSPGGVNRTELLRRIWGEDPEILHSEKNKGVYRTQIWWQRFANGKRLSLTCFVNGRRIENSTIRAAILSGESNSGGNWMVYIDVPPEEIDVNIHPAKTEVLFRHGGDLFESVRNAVAGLERKTVAMPSFKNESPGFIDRPESIKRNSFIEKTGPPYFKDRDVAKNNFCRVEEPVFFTEQEDVTPENIFLPLKKNFTSHETAFIPMGSDESRDKEMSSVDSEAIYMGQLASGYLLFDHDGLVVMDPHAAHERINFELIKTRAVDHRVVQRLTLSLDLPPSLAEDVQDKFKELEKLGFEISERDGVLQLSGIPEAIGSYGVSPVDALRAATYSLKENGEDGLWLKWATLACKASVKITSSLSEREALQLLKDLERCNVPSICPHGRPTMLRMDKNKLDRHFGRS